MGTETEKVRKEQLSWDEVLRRLQDVAAAFEVNQSRSQNQSQTQQPEAVGAQ